MSEIKTEIKQNADGSYTITDAHSTADVVRWLLTQDSKETVLYLLGDTPQRTWVGLTDEEIADCAEKMEASDPTDSFWREFFRGIEAKLKEKNT
ncbi:hypothetical protein UFOVP996_66 [uncultured Caudovirales phage]|uniref:Uncharacterized protein n=1 Tax=uncultured Caudovirales phage TaxID=2100421 RepID=A0A6J5Q0F0_9CAUD|nr:hypothetical protein UFOVP996_66 [uncultured Caudovirales phage]